MPELLARLADALDARPAEVVGLLVLLAGSVVCTVLLIAGGPAVVPASADPGVVLLDGANEPAGSEVTVHVAGAVRRPGVVVLPLGARVADAVTAAGGATVDAVLDGLNLAAALEDGQQVLVPSAVAAPSGDHVADRPGAIDAEGRVDLNRATADDLETLPGIGPVLAERIVTWREQHGPFRAPGDLRAVPGIGERTFQALADLVSV